MGRAGAGGTAQYKDKLQKLRKRFQMISTAYTTKTYAPFGRKSSEISVKNAVKTKC